MIKIGSIVKSVAGRDRERFMVVVAVEDGFAFLAEGKKRRLAKPKKKKLKHLLCTDTSIDFSHITSDKKLKRVLTDLGFSAGGPRFCDVHPVDSGEVFSLVEGRRN